jgi:hypothetical protein
MCRWKRPLWTLAIVVVSLVITLESAAAQVEKPWPTYRRGDGYTYFKRYKTPGPTRGYEGFAGPPLSMSYCSYRRIPNRECGPKGCRVTSWTLEQYCQ